MLMGIGRAIVIALVVTLACYLLGAILIAVNISLAYTIGDFLGHYAIAIGILAGLYDYFVR